MTRVQRIENFIVAIFLLFLAVIILFSSEKGYFLVFGLISFSWFIQSVRLLTYYFTMARFMVGGQRILLKGVLLFDLSIITSSFSDIPRIYVMLYLVGGMIFAYIVEVLRALDKKRCGAHAWKIKMVTAVAGIVLAIICLCNYESPRLAGEIYAVELIYAAIVRIYNSVRRTKIVLPV